VAELFNFYYKVANAVRRGSALFKHLGLVRKNVGASTQISDFVNRPPRPENVVLHRVNL